MSQEVKTLMEMGFSEGKSKKALAVTNFAGVEIAMEWLLAHAHEIQEPDPLTGLEENNIPSAGTNTNAEGPSKEKQPSSNVTQISGASTTTPAGVNTTTRIQIRFPNGISFTQTYTNKTKFSEVDKFIRNKLRNEHEEVPIMTAFPKRIFTVEDNEKFLDDLGLTPSGVIIVGRSEKEKEEFSERQRCTIQAEIDEKEAQKRREKEKLQKVIDDKKREMEQEKKIKERILADIEQDKTNRRIKAAGTNPNIAPHVPMQTEVAPSVVTSSIKQYATTSLQIRGPDGSANTKTFDSKCKLAVVSQYIEEQYYTEGNNLVIMTAFPRKEFTSADYDTPLDILGLVPSAVLIVKKASTNL